MEDLLLLARLDEGQPLKLSEVDLTQLVVESVSDEKVMAPGHNWQLELPEEPVFINGDASQLRQVFSRFVRADAARKGMGNEATASTAEGSSGLGLSIVESIVEAHGGKGNGDITPTTDSVRPPLFSGDLPRQGDAPPS